MSDSEESGDGFESASEGASPVSPSRKRNTTDSSANQVDQADQAETPPPQQPQHQQPETSWSGGGWGSWLSQAVTAVTESLQSDVDSLVSTAKDLGGGLKKITVESIDRVYETLDDAPKVPASNEIIEEGQRLAGGGDDDDDDGDEQRIEKQKADKKINAVNGSVGTGSILQSTEGVLGAIDRTLDFTSDLLGNAVLGGYRTIEAANLGDKIGRLKVNVEQSEVVFHSREVGENLLAHGLTALEAIGSVIGIQAAQSLAESRQRTPNIPGPAAGGRGRKKSVLSLSDYFEDNCGQAHLQALEMLAAESAIKVRSFDASSLDRCRQPFAEVERQFDLDDMLEEVMECEESVLLTEAGYQRAADNLHSIGCSNRQQLDQLRLLQSRLESVAVGKKTEWSKDLTSLISSDPAAAVDPLVLKAKYPEYLQALLQQSLQSMADLSEKSCEQLLRVSEILLMRTAELQLPAIGDCKPTTLDDSNNGGENNNTKNDDEEISKSSENIISEQELKRTGKELSSALRSVVLMLLTELQFASYSWTRLSNDLLTELREQSKPLAEDLRDLVEDEARQRLKDFSGQIDKNLSSSMTFIQEAMQSNLPIMKLLLLTMSSKSSTAPSNTNDANNDNADDGNQNSANNEGDKDSNSQPPQSSKKKNNKKKN